MKDKNFTQIPNEIIFNTELSDGAFRTLVALLSYKYGKFGKVFPSQETIAKRRGKSRETINGHVKELKNLKLVTPKKRGYSNSNLYSFNSENIFTHEKQERDGELTTIAEVLSHQKYQIPHSNNTKEKNTENKKGYETFLLMGKKLKEGKI